MHNRLTLTPTLTGGWVPHSVDGIIKGSAPAFWRKQKPASGVCRVSLLFREMKA